MDDEGKEDGKGIESVTKNLFGGDEDGGTQQGLNSANSSEVDDLNSSKDSNGDKDKDGVMNDSGSEGASSEEKSGSSGSSKDDEQTGSESGTDSQWGTAGGNREQCRVEPILRRSGR